jgi:hypothetical protein
MNKNILITIISGLLFQSCGFIFYNYRGYLDTEFSISNTNVDTTIRHEIGNFIYRLSTNEDFYTRQASTTYDSLYFYGPDYHRFNIKIWEENKTTKVYLHYFGYNGFRSRPPHKQFIQSLTDSLKIVYGATQTIINDVNNEKKKNQKNGN